MRLAQSVSGRRDLISFSSGFHGKTTGVRFSGGRFPEEQVSLGVDWVHSLPYPRCEQHDTLNYPACGEGRSGGARRPSTAAPRARRCRCG